MIGRHPPLLRLLVFAALADWLIARTLTRLLIFMPKSPGLIAFYKGLVFGGQLSITLASLLSLGFLMWMIWKHLRTERNHWLAISWMAIASIGLSALFIPLPLGLVFAYRILALMAIAVEGWRAVSAGETVAQKVAHAVPVLVLLVGGMHQGIQVLHQALPLPDLLHLSQVLFNLGEGLLVVASLAIWWAYGRGASRHVWLASLVLPAGFVILHTTNPALTGIISIWSMGLTLYLPWVLYAFSIWLIEVALLTLLGKGSPIGWALLLLAAGGYAPQTNIQVLYGLIALWLIARATATFEMQTGAAVSSCHTWPLELNPHFTGKGER